MLISFDDVTKYKKETNCSGLRLAIKKKEKTRFGK